MKCKMAWTAIICLIAMGAVAAVAADARREIRFPAPSGYETITLDPHMHTVFSDGSVWPSVRVDEAWRGGLDAISITDHVEYQPHKDDLPTNHNRPYAIARGRALAGDILLIKGAEITRDTPPGHFNALFVEDVDPLDSSRFDDDALEAVPEIEGDRAVLEVLRRAAEQGAFIFWNHHAWKGEERGQWGEVQQIALDRGWLHGMEVVNGGTYYPSAHRWCLEKGLTMIGCSDIHSPDLRRASTPDDHRALTLAFVKQRSADAVHEALREGRTVVWSGDQIIGNRAWLEKLFAACVAIDAPHHRSGDRLYVKIRNHCDVDVRLQRSGELGPDLLLLPAGRTTLLELRTKEDVPKLGYTAVNWLIAPEEGLPVELAIPPSP